jgi:mono/diheme cytochrome c family protein
MVGPGFKGIADRLPKPAEEWFIKYTLNNDSVYKSGDKYARKLRADYEGEEMTIFSGELTREQIKTIYSYLTSPPRQRGCVFE